MKYQFRTGVDHEYKRKVIVIALATAAVAILLGGMLRFGFYGSGSAGNTSLTRTQKEAQDTKKTSATTTSKSEGQNSGTQSAPSSVSISSTPRTMPTIQPSSGSSKGGGTVTAPGLGPVTLATLPVGGLGGGGTSSSGGDCLCQEVTSVVQPVVDQVQKPAANVIQPVLNTIHSVTKPVTNTVSGLLGGL